MVRKFTFATWLVPIALVIFALVGTLAAQEATEQPDIIEPSATFTPSATSTPTATFTSSATFTPETTDEPTATETPSPTESAESTEESTAEVTAEVTEELNPSVTVSASPGVTVTTISTDTLSPTPTFTPTAAASLDFRFMPTATIGIPMVYVSGQAAYQNRLPDDSGIKVYILNGDRVLLSIAQTDANGVYTLAVPSDAFYWLIIEAPLYKRFELGIWPGESLPQVVLNGGDMNADGCIGLQDIEILAASYDLPESHATDITGDGITDISDLAILTGNFESECEAALLTPTATVTPSVTPVDTIESTPEVTQPELTPETTAAP